MNTEKREAIVRLVEKHKGVWPEGEYPMVTYIPNFMMGLCEVYPQEFEQVARELGWVNGYRYGVKYQTNGEKPDLPDDVLVCIKDKRWTDIHPTPIPVGSWSWLTVDKFRIVDGRYKPQGGSSKPEVDNWYERGERPPVGSGWTHTNGNKYTVIGFANEGSHNDKYPVTIIYQGENGKIWCRPLTEWYRSMTPIKNERERLIEEAIGIFEEAACKQDYSMVRGIGAIYDAGMLKEPTP